MEASESAEPLRITGTDASEWQQCRAPAGEQQDGWRHYDVPLVLNRPADAVEQGLFNRKWANRRYLNGGPEATMDAQKIVLKSASLDGLEKDASTARAVLEEVNSEKPAHVERRLNDEQGQHERMAAAARRDNEIADAARAVRDALRDD